MKTAALCLAAAASCLAPAGARAGRAYSHGWDTVGDAMAMHGKYSNMERPADADIEYVVKHYRGMITTGTGCAKGAAAGTIEESVLETAARIKAINPKAVVGMYWRMDFALELAGCSGFAEEWKAHPEYRLKNDNGVVVGAPGHYYYDYLNPAASGFFAKVLLNATTWTMPSGKPILDYIYCDGAGSWATPRPFAPGIGLARSQKLLEAKHAMLASIQSQLDARGHGQNLILNGMDLVGTAQEFVRTGAGGAMFDHWSILQFLDRQTGQFNATEMDEGFQLVASPLLSNFTTQIKGWVGPVVKQRGLYPPNFQQVNTSAGMIREASERFNSELALFLLVATEHDFWIYSWFWGWYDYVGGNPQSSIPADFFPQASCKLGAPEGPYERVAGTYTYKRQFAHASVFVDLTNRTNSRVDFVGCSAPTPPLPPTPAPAPITPPSPSPSLHRACPAMTGKGCAACTAVTDSRCPGIWCGQQCVHLSKEVGGHDCQPAKWWDKFAAKYEKQGIKCSGNATGCSRSCA